MPIRIKELVVRSNISKDSKGQKNDEGSLTEKKLHKMKNWILEECMDEVNKLLEKRNLK